MLTRNASWPGPNHGVIVPRKPQGEGPTLLAEVEAFARRHRLRPSSMCRDATGNGGLYDRLRNGLNPQPITIEKLRRWMRRYEERASR